MNNDSKGQKIQTSPLYCKNLKVVVEHLFQWQIIIITIIQHESVCIFFFTETEKCPSKTPQDALR